MSTLRNLTDYPETSAGHRSERTRILLSLSRSGDRDRLTDWLTPTFDVNVSDGAPEETPADLCIVDTPSLDSHQEAFERMKRNAAPVILPVVLLTTSTRPEPLGSRVWEVVDDIVTIPTDPRILRNRLSLLLERRKHSQGLSDEVDRQKQYFQKIFESSNDAIFVVDPAAERIRECNPQACELLGYSRSELLSLSGAELHPEEMSRHRDFFKSVLEQGHGWTDELTYRRRSGEIRNAEISASVIDIDDEPYVIANVRDVTARQDQRRVLDNLHDVTAELMNAPTDDAIADVTVDATREVFEFDIAAVRLHNEDTTPETLELVAGTEKTYRALSPQPPTYEVGERFVGSTYATQEPTVIEDLRLEDTPITYEPIRSAMCFPLGPHGVLSIGSTEPAAFDDADFELMNILATNTTAALTRAGRERALSERTEFFSGLFENTTDCIAEVEFDGRTARVRDVNPAFERVFGYSAEGLRGDRLIDVVVPPEGKVESKELVDDAVAGRSAETEGQRETASGRRDFIIRVVPVTQHGETIGGYVVYTDITEQKRRDQQLQVLNRVLRHNIRNKLNVVSGVMEQGIEVGDRIPESLARKGQRAVKDLLQLSETARDLSRETRPREDRDPVSVHLVVARTVESLERTYPDATVEIRTNVDPWLAGSIQFERVVHELCENAIKHSDRSSPSVTVTVESAADDGWTTVSVADDGPGIPADQRAVLRNGEETPLQHGNGLGLWAVQWIVRGAGGELTLANGEERGAVVSVTLPTVSVPEDTQRRVTDHNR